MAHVVSNTKITAAESTENIPSSRRVRDVADRIMYLDPSAAPLTLVLAKAKKESVFNAKFEWIEKDLPARWNGTTATSTDTDTTIDVEAGTYFTAGDLVKVPRTGEVFRVVSISTNALTVVRAVDGDGTTGSAINDNEDLLIIGNAYAEGAALGTIKSHQETYPYNYTQIVRTPFGVTGTEDASENYTGKDRPRLRAEKAIEHKIDLERTALFGERNIFTSGDSDATTNKPRRYTGGFLYYATSNAKDMSGTMTEPELEDWCEDLFHHTAGGDTRLALASPLACSVIDQLGVGRLQLVPKNETLGLAVKQFVTSHGELMIVKHRLLVDGQTSGGTTEGYGGYILGVDAQKMAYCYLRGRDTKLRVDVGTPGDDSWTDEYMTEMGWKVINPQVHGTATGITS